MAETPISADNDNKSATTVVERVMGAFYSVLAQKEEFKDIAERLQKENGHTEATLRQTLFGEDDK